MLPRPHMVTGLAILVFFAFLVEWARFQIRWARYYFLRRTRSMLRRHERRRFSGATYMALGYLGALLIFPLPIAVLAMLYNGLGDAAAAVAGKRWGRRRASWGKSLEGLMAGFTVNLLLGLAIPGVPVPAALAGAAAAAVLEFLPLPMDDNLRVPLGGGAAAWAVLALVAPAQVG